MGVSRPNLPLPASVAGTLADLVAAGDAAFQADKRTILQASALARSHWQQTRLLPAADYLPRPTPQ
jgi:hypothetical protein